MKKWLLIWIALLPTSVFADTSGPQNVVEDIFSKTSKNEIVSDVSKQNEVKAFVDFNTLAKSSLGKEFVKTPKKEFEWFRDTLSEIITRTVFPKAPEFLQGVRITYQSVEEKNGKALVKSTVQNKADLTDVEYKLEKSKDGLWKVVDVSISGISWVQSIQEQVSSVLKKKKWAGLKEALNKRLNDIKASKN